MKGTFLLNHSPGSVRWGTYGYGHESRPAPARRGAPPKEPSTMIRHPSGSAAGELASFDPFSGPSLAEEQELAELMRQPAAAGPDQAAHTSELDRLEAELDERLELSLPRWDQLEIPSVYARWVRPVLTLTILLFALPASLLVMAPIALINWFATGDHRLIFFTQERVGQYGHVFRIYKFRTMRPVTESGDFEAWSRGDKNRVTPFGRFLRSTHLDEVPQILNILLGDMNFIGPRPEMVAVHNWACREVPGFERRLALRPGITGLAQITQGYAGQCPEAYAEKLAGDERYREGLSFAMDVRILVATAFWMVRGRGWNWQG